MQCSSQTGYMKVWLHMYVVRVVQWKFQKNNVEMGIYLHVWFFMWLRGESDATGCGKSVSKHRLCILFRLVFSAVILQLTMVLRLHPMLPRDQSYIMNIFHLKAFYISECNLLKLCVWIKDIRNSLWKWNEDVKQNKKEQVASVRELKILTSFCIRPHVMP